MLVAVTHVDSAADPDQIHRQIQTAMRIDTKATKMEHAGIKNTEKYHMTVKTVTDTI